MKRTGQACAALLVVVLCCGGCGALFSSAPRRWRVSEPTSCKSHPGLATLDLFLALPGIIAVGEGINDYSDYGGGGGAIVGGSIVFSAFVASFAYGAWASGCCDRARSAHRRWLDEHPAWPPPSERHPATRRGAR